MNPEYLKIFERFVPKPAASYCLKLWDSLGFEFKIKKSRQTKLGDYRYAHLTKKHTITINNDLNPYAFLVTYLHEVAHMVTFEAYGHKASPHGKEWKINFRKIAQPILTNEIFPQPVLQALLNYFKNPKAASCSDPYLYNALKSFDEPNGKTLLKRINPGTTFDFNGRVFRKLEKKRTRSVCLELKTNRRYLISELAEIQVVQEE